MAIVLTRFGKIFTAFRELKFFCDINFLLSFLQTFWRFLKALPTVKLSK